jgi:colanic acid biosynthesis glycosyl transferase WcaI
MRFLLLNQTFHPDVTATGQHLSEAAARLVERGHAVEVVTSRRAYDQPGVLFARRESWRGVRILRVGSTGFGKGARWKRAADFGSFMALCCARAATVRRPDVVVALTSPPLISYLGARLAKLRRARFCYWVMDFNPDEAIAAGWLRADSLVARLLDRLSRFSLRRADRIIALDRFMRDRIVAKGIPADRVSVISPWTQDDNVRYDPAGRARFRRAHGLDDKFVVMYSGNHSPCHPLDTLLEAARQLRAEANVGFCFVGGGSEFARVQQFAADHALTNVLCLPYQPFDQLAGSLSAADLHAVVMGERFVGLVHPCKVYNILAVGAPLLYIGPAPSHVTEIMDAAAHLRPTAADLPSVPFYRAAHGDAPGVVAQIRAAQAAAPRGRQRQTTGPTAASPWHCFSKETLLNRLLADLEALAQSR